MAGGRAGPGQDERRVVGSDGGETANSYHVDSYSEEPAMRGYDVDGVTGPQEGKAKGSGGISELNRLVEALHGFDEGGLDHMDSYLGSDEEGLCGSGGMRGLASFNALGLDDMRDDVGLLDGGKRGKRGGYARSEAESYGYASEMNPKLKGKKVPLLEERCEEEFCAAPFNQDAAEAGTAEAAEPPTVWPQQPFRRGWRFNWPGVVLMALYCLAFIFYLYIRIRYTLDLGAYVWWGAFVLGVEILGATSTVLYGVNIILTPVHEPLVDDPANPGLTKVSNSYHVRVLVPCYKEDLEIVAKTIQAAYNARLPDNCSRTIYLCDDGKDKRKRKWCEQMGPEIIYVSGRTRASGEMNGKSANLNNSLGQIYPAGVRIPPTELACIFDADQVANPDFFLKTLPLFDAGDDVGMVLSPQCFHNIDAHADIFNHGNVQFWEYAQVGYDAIGFISCTGTNFLTRSCAFAAAGWSPTYTLTEDYALGMELKKRHWQCRYVNEYLAVGEAPEQVRNCFQQRSRWAKGHFQMILSNQHCPLFQRELPWWERVMYCTGVWSYLVGAVTTPVFIAVPLVTIWAGIFPIVVSWWAAVGLTTYFVAQYAVLNYVRQFKHVTPLWFANVANNILWWTFVKACWRAAGSMMADRGITFKTTMKGAGRLMNANIGDLWMPTICLLGLFASLGFGLFKVVTGPTVVTTLSISLVWLIYTAIPPYLLLHYHFVGRGQTLRWACRICFWISSLCGIAAIILLWLVYPKQYDYGQVLSYSHTFYDAERLGQVPANGSVPWRAPSLLYERGPARLGFGANLTGGWEAGGMAGTLKLTMPTAFTVAMLAWGLLEFPEGYARAGQMARAHDNLRWGADYLMKTISRPVAGGSRYQDFYIAYQVGNYTLERATWQRPEDMHTRRPVYYVATKNGTSDLVGQMVGALVSTALVFQETDAPYYDRLMTQALSLYGAGMRKRGKYSDVFLYDCAPQDPAAILVDPVTLACRPPDQQFQGSMVYWYNSTSYRDDLAWAASWMYKATGDQAYLADAYSYWTQHVNMEGDFDLRYLVDWDNIIYPTTVLLAQLTDDKAFHTGAQSYFQKWLCSSGNTISYTPLGRAYNRFNPALGQTMNAAMLAVIYGGAIAPQNATQLEVAPRYNDGSKSQKYICFARKQSRYMLGDKTGASYVVGFGPHFPQRPADRGASCPAQPENCTTVNGLYNPAPNPRVLTGALVMDPRTWDYFEDNRASNDTWVSVELNAGFTSVMAGMNQVTGTYDQCLQGYGILARDVNICG
ncbi:hypothetical protein WJX81_004238 [Elliptochloris bilobata]|uniref:cellulase n=1 Tax=Elliptochloris bilobata TaxID=381761 RepID=A0AAW1QZA9_9CHLO